MRRIARTLLLLLAFAIPWEYSLDLGEPLGNIARIAGLALLLAAVPAVLQAGRLRTPGTMLWLVLALYIWLCCSYFWSIEPEVTLEKMRGYFQEMMLVWLVWELAEKPSDLRDLLRAFVAGSWILAMLTLANFTSAEAIAADQIRFVAEGQDPNDVARFLDVALPLAALLLNSERSWISRLFALGYLPLGLTAVVLTASRGGFLVAVLALAGSAFLLMRNYPRGVFTAMVALPVLAATLWFTAPFETFARLATIPAELDGGDLNLRLNIWDAGWHAFVRASLIGAGAGTFTSAAGTNPLDTAHNTALSILVGGGLCAFFLAVAISVLAVQSALATCRPVRIALLSALAVWGIASLVDTVEENRTTWLLLGLLALAGRLALEVPQEFAELFAGGHLKPLLAASTKRSWPSGLSAHVAK